MVYTAEQKQALDTLLKAFQDYIQQHPSFDILYSEKIGYVRLQVERTSDVLPEVVNTPEDLLGILFNEIINDVVFSQDNPQYGHTDSNLTEYEEAESRKRITALLETLDNSEPKAHYLNFLEKYIKEY